MGSGIEQFNIIREGHYTTLDKAEFPWINDLGKIELVKVESPSGESFWYGSVINGNHNLSKIAERRNKPNGLCNPQVILTANKVNENPQFEPRLRHPRGKLPVYYAKICDDRSYFNVRERIVRDDVRDLGKRQVVLEIARCHKNCEKDVLRIIADH